MTRIEICFIQVRFKKIVSWLVLPDQIIKSRWKSPGCSDGKMFLRRILTLVNFYIPEENKDEEKTSVCLLRYGIKIPQNLKNPNG